MCPSMHTLIPGEFSFNREFEVCLDEDENPLTVHVASADLVP